MLIKSRTELIKFKIEIIKGLIESYYKKPDQKQLLLFYHFSREALNPVFDELKRNFCIKSFELFEHFYDKNRKTIASIDEIDFIRISAYSSKLFDLKLMIENLSKRMEIKNIISKGVLKSIELPKVNEIIKQSKIRKKRFNYKPKPEIDMSESAKNERNLQKLKQEINNVGGYIGHKGAIYGNGINSTQRLREKTRRQYEG
jgi:hypothetical protein